MRQVHDVCTTRTDALMMAATTNQVTFCANAHMSVGTVQLARSKTSDVRLRPRRSVMCPLATAKTIWNASPSEVISPTCASVAPSSSM